MWVEIKLSLITTYYIWAIWDLVMSNIPEVGFDYVLNAILRLREFKKDFNQCKVNGGKEYLKQLANQIFQSDNLDLDL